MYDRNYTSKVQYTLATKLNSTRSTLWKVDKVQRVALTPYTLATKSTATSCQIHVVANLLPKPATKSTVSATVDFVAGFGNSRLSPKSTVLNSTLSPVCTRLNIVVTEPASGVPPTATSIRSPNIQTDAAITILPGPPTQTTLTLG